MVKAVDMMLLDSGNDEGWWWRCYLVVMMKAGDMMLLDSGNDEGWWYDVVR